MDIKQINRLEYELTWTGTPPFTIFKNGEKILTTNATSMVVNVEPNESNVYEVDGTDITFNRRAIVSWQPSAGASGYKVEQYIDDDWVLITETRGVKYETAQLNDQEIYKYRVIPFDAKGAEGAPREYEALILGVPDAPEPTFAYESGTQKLTITI